MWKNLYTAANAFVGCYNFHLQLKQLAKHAHQRALKPAFHDTDIDTDTDSPDTHTSLRSTRAISWSYSCGKLNGEVARHADILATILSTAKTIYNDAGTYFFALEVFEYVLDNHRTVHI